MFLKEGDNLFHWLNLIESSVFDHFDISKVGHNSHKELFVRFLFSSLWKNFDSSGNFLDESFNVLYFFNCVVEKERSVAVNPICDGVLKLFDKWSSVNS
jgi:hypothetical protein